MIRLAPVALVQTTMFAVSFRCLSALLLTLLVLVVPPRMAAADGCSGSIYWPSPSSIDCQPDCDSHCQSLVVNTPEGQGAICICSANGWTGCCTIALVPPSGSGFPVPVGDCGEFGCPGDGGCHEFTQILQDEPYFIWRTVPRCY